MGNLADQLNNIGTTPPTPNLTHQDSAGGVRTTRVEGPHDSSSPTTLLEALGHDPSVLRFAAPPAVYVKLDEDGSTLWTTYRYVLDLVPVKTSLEPLIERVKAANVSKPANASGEHWFVFQAGDMQLGKVSRDGSTEQILERYMDSVQNAVAEYSHLKRHGIGGIQIAFAGDCIEGIVSQGGKNMWLTQETITEQTRILRRLMLHTVEAFAPLTDRLYMDTVNGNHDVSQRVLNTYPGDGWATECAIAVQDALKMNEAAYGHVEVRVPDKWEGSLTVPVGDTTVTLAHGHQWSRGKGMGWLKDQDFGRQAARGTQVLQHGHIHTWELETTRDIVRVASPTYDCGSDWFREVRGGDAKRGGLAYLLRSGEVSRMSLV